MSGRVAEASSETAHSRRLDDAATKRDFRIKVSGGEGCRGKRKDSKLLDKEGGEGLAWPTRQTG